MAYIFEKLYGKSEQNENFLLLKKTELTRLTRNKEQENKINRKG